MTGFFDRITEKKGLLLFGGILVVVIIVAMAAYQLTGSMSIEKRFNNAVGLPSGGEETGGGLFGFSLEGNPVFYGAVLCGLGILCYAAYRYIKI